MINSIPFVNSEAFYTEDKNIFISVESHKDDWSDVVYGELNLNVKHDISIERDPYTRLEAAGSDITDNREVPDGCGYDADVTITAIFLQVTNTRMFPFNLCAEDVELIAAAIGKAACDKAEESDNEPYDPN